MDGTERIVEITPDNFDVISANMGYSSSEELLKEVNNSYGTENTLKAEDFYGKYIDEDLAEGKTILFKDMGEFDIYVEFCPLLGPGVVFSDRDMKVVHV